MTRGESVSEIACGLCGSTNHRKVTHNGLKRSLKQQGRYKLTANIIRFVPGLALVSALLLPFWLYGLAADKLSGGGRTMLVLGKKAD